MQNTEGQQGKEFSGSVFRIRGKDSGLEQDD
jgi:hypothetical protein